MSEIMRDGWNTYRPHDGVNIDAEDRVYDIGYTLEGDIYRCPRLKIVYRDSNPNALERFKAILADEIGHAGNLHFTRSSDSHLPLRVRIKRVLTVE